LSIRTPYLWDEPRPRTFMPGDPQWPAARRVFRTHYLLYGEIYAHLGKAHLQMEQYGIALYRNLRFNPVRHVLAPHLQEIVPVNRDGDSIGWGSEAILAFGTALKADGIYQRAARYVASLDWSAWSPRQPLCESHIFARAGLLYWEMLGKYLDLFFTENADEISRHWIEVRRFSDDLVAHSAPYRPLPSDPDIVYDDRSEMDDEARPRAEAGGLPRAVRPVTTTDGPPSPQDLDSLKQLCRYVLYHTTFYHAGVHDRQGDDGGEIDYATVALRNGSLGEEDRPDIAPTPAEASYGLLTINVGVFTRYGFIVANEEKDVPPLLLATLQGYAERFADLGFDVAQIRSRINI
jgi:hypothetical protein